MDILETHGPYPGPAAFTGVRQFPVLAIPPRFMNRGRFPHLFDTLKFLTSKNVKLRRIRPFFSSHWFGVLLIRRNTPAIDNNLWQIHIRLFILAGSRRISRILHFLADSRRGPVACRSCGHFAVPFSPSTRHVHHCNALLKGDFTVIRAVFPAKQLKWSKINLI